MIVTIDRFINPSLFLLPMVKEVRLNLPEAGVVGTFQYDPALLEGFVEKFAEHWKVQLGNLEPAQSYFASTPFLERLSVEK